MLKKFEVEARFSLKSKLSKSARLERDSGTLSAGEKRRRQ